MEFFSGMDVSIDEMAICVVDEKEGGGASSDRGGDRADKLTSGGLDQTRTEQAERMTGFG